MFSLWYLSLYSHWSPRFWPARFMFCIMFFKTEIKQLRLTVSLKNITGNIPCEGNTKRTSPFRWILIHCNLFVMRYIFWLKIAVKHETLSIKSECFHFSPHIYTSLITHTFTHPEVQEWVFKTLEILRWLTLN